MFWVTRDLFQLSVPRWVFPSTVSDIFGRKASIPSSLAISRSLFALTGHRGITTFSTCIILFPSHALALSSPMEHSHFSSLNTTYTPLNYTIRGCLGWTSEWGTQYIRGIEQDGDEKIHSNTLLREEFLIRILAWHAACINKCRSGWKTPCFAETRWIDWLRAIPCDAAALKGCCSDQKVEFWMRNPIGIVFVVIWYNDRNYF